jgi:hypothetical protein
VEDATYITSRLSGWKNSRGHKRQIFVDKMGEYSWTLLVNFHGHFFNKNDNVIK